MRQLKGNEKNPIHKLQPNKMSFIINEKIIFETTK